MSETNDGTTVRVNDRRRFDADGNARPDPAPEPAPESPPKKTQAEPSLAPVEPQELAAAKAELEATRKRLDEVARGYQGLLRDREEFKERLTRERDRLMAVEKGNAASVLLDVLDELDLSLQAVGKERSPLADGIRMIRDGIIKKLEGMGIQRVEMLGQKFDPNLAEAADMEITASADDDQKVTAEVRAGYKLGDQLIRPARVRVAKYVQPAHA